MMKQNRIGLIVLTAVLTMAVAPTAMAASKDFCHYYAKKSVKQASLAQQWGFGCTGFRWHNWYEGHYRWCRAVSKGAAKSELYVRNDVLYDDGIC